MTDIVKRLRHCSDNCGDEYLHELSGRAADTITALRAENERLRADHKAACDLAERHMNEKHKLLAAICWIEPPFVDDQTPESELRSRIKLCVADAKRAAMEGK